MALVNDLFRRLVAVGITLFFAALIFLLVTFIARNPHVIPNVLAGIDAMVRQVFSLANGG